MNDDFSFLLIMSSTVDRLCGHISWLCVGSEAKILLGA